MRLQFFVFLQCGSGRTYDVGQEIARRRNPSVVSISSISGEWDLLLDVRIDSRKDVGREMVALLQGIEGVQRTNTIVAYPVFNPEDVYFNEDGDP
jgi:DNA-binding Lrp family transcriptional regulator